jgi:hypothetical protein
MDRHDSIFRWHRSILGNFGRAPGSRLFPNCAWITGDPETIRPRMAGLVAKNAAVMTRPLSRCTVVGENTRFAFNAEDLPSGMKHYAVIHRLRRFCLQPR